MLDVAKLERAVLLKARLPIEGIKVESNIENGELIYDLKGTRSYLRQRYSLKFPLTESGIIRYNWI